MLTPSSMKFTSVCGSLVAISWQSIDLQGEARWKLISGCWGVCGSFQGLENKMAEEDQVQTSGGEVGQHPSSQAVVSGD